MSFFYDNIDIARFQSQLALANELGLPTDTIVECMQDGTAMAGLFRDVELCCDYAVGGSPSYVLNEGWQKLYGNVGYKVIAANVNEVINQTLNQTSWC